MKAFNKLSLAIAMSLLSLWQLSAQINTQEINHILAPLDMSFVTTNLLTERTLPMVRLENYTLSSEADTLVSNYGTVSSMYMSMYGSMLPGTQPLDHPDNVYRQARKDWLGSGTAIPLILAAFDYHSLVPTGIDDGTLYFSNGQLNHNPNVDPSTAFVKKRSFASGLFSHELAQNTNVTLDPDYLLGNIAIDPTSIYLDADDGRGYLALTLGQEHGISYDSLGARLCKLRYATLDGDTTVQYLSVLISESALIQGIGGALNLSTRGETLNNYDEYATLENIGFDTLIGVNGDSALVSVQLACGDGDSSQVRKPLIVMDGIDFSWTENKYSMKSLIEKNDRGLGFKDPNLLGSKELNQVLKDDDFDVIFIDWRDHHIDIRDNAEIVEEVIRMVNRWKKNNGSKHENVVMAVSMGGLIGKTALREMELQGEDHEASHYITFDSPMQGANVPLAVQEAIKYVMDAPIPVPSTSLALTLRSVIDHGDINMNSVPITIEQDSTYLILKELRNQEKVMTSTAAQQMMIYSAYTDNDDKITDLHKEFFGMLEDIGDLENCKTIAIANGSNKGYPLGGQRDILDSLTLVPGDPILIMDDVSIGLEADALEIPDQNIWEFEVFAATLMNAFTSLVINILNAEVEINLNMNTLSGSDDQLYFGSQIQANGFFDQVIVYDHTKHAKTKTSMLPVDTAPGSIIGASVLNADPTDLVEGLPEGMELFVEELCFMPTVSALDLQPTAPGGDINPSLLNMPVIQESSSTYDYWTTQNAPIEVRAIPERTLENNGHVGFTFDNISLLLSTISGDINLRDGGFNPLFDRIYNFGDTKQSPNPIGSIFQFKSTNHFLPEDLRVVLSSEIWINRDDQIGFISPATNLPNADSSYFDVYLSEDFCNGEKGIVSFETTTTLHIGDASVENIGDLFITDETELHIREGSLLLIEDGSRLIVESGGELHLHDGAEIEVLGAGGIVVEDGGKLILHQKANINLDQAGMFEGTVLRKAGSHLKIHGELFLVDGVFSNTGAGYVHFDEGHPTVTSDTDNIIITGQGSMGPINIYNNAKTIIRQNILMTDCNLVNNDVLDFRHMTFARLESSRTFGGDYRYRSVTYIELEEVECENTKHEIHETGIFTATGSQFFGGTGDPCIMAFHASSINLRACDFFENTSTIISERTDYGILLSDVTISHIPTTNQLSNITTPHTMHTYISPYGAIHLANPTNLSMHRTLIDNAEVGVCAPFGANVSMKNGSTISNCVAGIFMMGTGDLGMVDMDCSNLIDNEVGVLGTDVLLNIDAYEIATATDCELRPNSFINDHYGQENMFNIKYVQRDIPIVHAKGNFWRSGAPSDPLVVYNLTNANKHIDLDINNRVISQPTGCAPFQNNCNPGDPINSGGIAVNNPFGNFDGNTTSIYNYTPPNWISTMHHTYAPAYLHYVKYLSGQFNNGEGGTVDWEQYYYGLEALQDIADLSCEEYYSKLPSYVRNRVDVARSLMGTQCYTLDGRASNNKRIGFSLSPNPASDVISIDLDQVFDQLELLNATGQIIDARSLESIGNTYDVKDFQSGIYFIKLTNTLTGNSGVRKFIKI